MTELSRHRRPQDLATLIHNLENYREQNVDFDFELASAEAGASAGAKKQVILSKLQERLFEISRRNRLLHFRPTMHAVNLTHASVPLSFDVKSIRPEQILTWTGDFARGVSAGEVVPLSRHLNFTEQLYLPSVLDRIRADLRRGRRGSLGRVGRAGGTRDSRPASCTECRRRRTSGPTGAGRAAPVREPAGRPVQAIL